VATPLLVALVLVEISDVVFALDSIPAIFGITLDPFIVFTSNIFAILGLRSLYFALSSAIDTFAHLGRGLGLVLAFIGAKMLAAPWVEVGQWTSLAVVAALLAGAVVASLLWPPARQG
jgi:tellurite resistance protein TerC